MSGECQMDGYFCRLQNSMHVNITLNSRVPIVDFSFWLSHCTNDMMPNKLVNIRKIRFFFVLSHLPSILSKTNASNDHNLYVCVRLHANCFNDFEELPSIFKSQRWKVIRCTVMPILQNWKSREKKIDSTYSNYYKQKCRRQNLM